MRRQDRAAGCLQFIRYVAIGGAVGLLCGLLWLAAALYTGLPRMIERIGPPSPDLNPANRLFLTAYLISYEDALDQPAGDSAAVLELEVIEGETADSVIERLHFSGIVTNDFLLRSYMRYYGSDIAIQAGQYELTGAMTIIELAEALQEALRREGHFTILEGWRREQIAQAIQIYGLPIDPAAFLALTTRVPPDHPLAGELPAEAGLEGFLFPDTYRLDPEIDAEMLVSYLLDNFELKVGSELRDGFQSQGLSLYQAVTLASIIEREAVLDDERPRIASVFLNRLATGMNLDADPTVQYALGQQADGSWWKVGLLYSDLLIESPYNTYLYPGLPPGPISNPGLESLLAVAFPESTPYYYFRALCDGSGGHAFSETYEEHLKNTCP